MHLFQINFTQHISSITTFDTISGELVTSGFFAVTWQDELIAWNPANYGGKTHIPVSQKTLWTPKIALSNSISNDEVFIDSSGLVPIFIDNTGMVIMYPAGTYRTRCNLDIVYYPFDEHLCEYYFIITNHDASEVIIHLHTNEILFGSNWENGEWWVSRTKTQDSDATTGYLNIAYAITSMTLKRRPIYEILNSFVPIVILTFLNLFACFLHPQCGERISFSITLYLAFVVLVTSMLDRMPRSTLQLPIISYLMCLLNVVNAAGIIWGIYMVYVAQSPAPTLTLPKCCAVIERFFMGKNRSNIYVEYNAESEKTDCANHGKDNQLEVHGKQDDNSNTKQLGDFTCVDSQNMGHMSRVLDRVYFCIVFIICVGVSMTAVGIFALS